jgi:hemoglobin
MDKGMRDVRHMTPYELMGGETALRQIVGRFFDIMLTDRGAAELRAMHADDLGPMREKLFDYMSGSLGGPNLYVRRADRKAMGEGHSGYAMGAAERGQWLHCMRRALSDVGVAPEVRAQLEKQLVEIAEAMRTS